MRADIVDDSRMRGSRELAHEHDSFGRDIIIKLFYNSQVPPKKKCKEDILR